MNRIARLWVAIVLMIGVSAQAQILTNGGPCTVVFNVTDFIGNAQAVQRLVLQPLPPTGGVGMFSSDVLVPARTSYPTGTNGSVTVSNVATGYAYKVQLLDQHQPPLIIGAWTNVFPTNLAGQTVLASACLGVNAGPVFGWLLGAGTNVTYTFTNGTLYINCSVIAGNATLLNGVNGPLNLSVTNVTGTSNGLGLTLTSTNMTLVMTNGAAGGGSVGNVLATNLIGAVAGVFVNINGTNVGITVTNVPNPLTNNFTGAISLLGTLTNSGNVGLGGNLYVNGNQTNVGTLGVGGASTLNTTTIMGLLGVNQTATFTQMPLSLQAYGLATFTGISNAPTTGFTNNGIGLWGNGGGLTNLAVSGLAAGPPGYILVPNGSGVPTWVNTLNVNLTGGGINNNWTNASLWLTTSNYGNQLFESDSIGLNWLSGGSSVQEVANQLQLSGGGHGIVIEDALETPSSGFITPIAAGGNITLTPSGSGANRIVTITSTASGGGGGNSFNPSQFNTNVPSAINLYSVPSTNLDTSLGFMVLTNCYHDCKYATNGAVTNSTAFYGGPFTASDAGKLIDIGYGSGSAQQVFTIAAYVNAGQVTLSGSYSGTAHNIWYSTGHDDAAQINLTITNALSNNCNIIIVPPGQYMLNTWTTLPYNAGFAAVALPFTNCDIKLNGQLSFGFMGLQRPSPAVYANSTFVQPLSTNGAIFCCPIYPLTPNTYALIGSPATPNTLSLGLDGINLILQDMTFRMGPNPGCSCIDAKGLSGLSLRGAVAVDSGTATPYAAAATVATSYGIYFPILNNFGSVSGAEVAQVSGFYNGFYVNEHLAAGFLWSECNHTGIQFGASYHDNYIGRYLAQFTGTHFYNAGAINTTYIGEYDAEEDETSITPYNFVNNLYDTANDQFGGIGQVHLSVSSGVYGAVTNNGGTNFNMPNSRPLLTQINAEQFSELYSISNAAIFQAGITETNLANNAYFMVTTNGHITAIDENGAEFLVRTNASMLLSNTLGGNAGNYTLQSNGNFSLSGTITIENAATSSDTINLNSTAAGGINTSISTSPAGIFLNSPAKVILSANTGVTLSSAATFQSMTASTLGYINGSQTFTSLANGSGVLTNNGSGTFSWVPVAGGGVLAGTNIYVNGTTVSAFNLLPIFSVADYGGDPTGVASSVPAFFAAQLAATNGGIVWFGPGVWLLATNIWTDYGGNNTPEIDYQGAGISSTILKFTCGTNSTNIGDFNFIGGTSGTFSKLSDMTIWNAGSGNDLLTPQVFVQSNIVEINNVKFLGGINGSLACTNIIFGLNSSFPFRGYVSRVTGCSSVSSGCFFYGGDGCNGAWLQNNYITSQPFYDLGTTNLAPFILSNTAYCYVANNTIEGAGWAYGVALRGQSGANSSGNHIASNPVDDNNGSLLATVLFDVNTINNFSVDNWNNNGSPGLINSNPVPSNPNFPPNQWLEPNGGSNAGSGLLLQQSTGYRGSVGTSNLYATNGSFTSNLTVLQTNKALTFQTTDGNGGSFINSDGNHLRFGVLNEAGEDVWFGLALGGKDAHVYAGDFNTTGSGFVGSGVGLTGIPLSGLANIAANTIVGNPTGSATAPTATGNPIVTNGTFLNSWTNAGNATNVGTVFTGGLIVSNAATNIGLIYFDANQHDYIGLTGGAWTAFGTAGLNFWGNGLGSDFQDNITTLGGIQILRGITNSAWGVSLPLVTDANKAAQTESFATFAGSLSLSSIGGTLGLSQLGNFPANTVLGNASGSAATATETGNPSVSNMIFLNSWTNAGNGTNVGTIYSGGLVGSNSLTLPYISSAGVLAVSSAGAVTGTGAPAVSGASLTANTIPLASLAQGTSGQVVIANTGSADTYSSSPAISGANITGASIPIASLGTIAPDTILANNTGGTASATAVTYASIESAFSLSALGGSLNPSQIANIAANTVLGNATGASAAVTATANPNIGGLLGVNGIYLTNGFTNTGYEFHTNNGPTALAITGNTNGYFEMVITNTSTGTNASADVTLGNANTTASTYYFNLGYNGSLFTNLALPPGNSNDAYIVTQGNSTNGAPSGGTNGNNIWISAGPTNSALFFGAGTGNTVFDLSLTNGGTLLSFISATGTNNLSPYGWTNFGTNSFNTLNGNGGGVAFIGSATGQGIMIAPSNGVTTNLGVLIQPSNTYVGATLYVNSVGFVTNGVQIPIYLPYLNPSAAQAGAVMASANKTYFYGFSVSTPTLVTKISYNIGLAITSDHVGFSIYAATAEYGFAAGTKIMDTGPLSTATANNFSAAITNAGAAYTLQPGPYWMAWNMDNTTATLASLIGAATNTALLNVNGTPSWCGTFTTAPSGGQNPVTSGGQSAVNVVALPVLVLQ